MHVQISAVNHGLDYTTGALASFWAHIDREIMPCTAHPCFGFMSGGPGGHCSCSDSCRHHDTAITCEDLSHALCGCSSMKIGAWDCQKDAQVTAAGGAWRWQGD